MKLVLAQMLVEPGRRTANIARAQARIGEAARLGADLVLLPECLDLGWSDPSARDQAEPIPEGYACRCLAEAARRHRIFVCAGLTERAGDHLFNAAVLLDDEGSLRLHHRKIHELDFARALYATGDRAGVAETPWGRIGLMICADGFVPGQVISRTLAAIGASVILSPCAWAVPAGHDNAREPYGALWCDNYGVVCRDDRLVIAGCSSVGIIGAGPWQGRHCIGNSLVVDASGVLAQGAYGHDADMLVEIELPTPSRPTSTAGSSPT